MTDLELDERVTALEENGGGGNPGNGKEKRYVNTDNVQPEFITVFNISFKLFQTPSPSTLY